MSEVMAADGGPSGFWSIWPFRLALLFIATVLTYGGVQLLIMLGAPKVAALWPAVPKDAATLGAAVIGCAVLIALYRVTIRWTEKRWPKELGARRAVPLFVSGAIIGALLFCAVYAVLFVLHIATFKGFGSTDGAALSAAMALAAGVGEEIVMRGIVFRLVEDGMGTLVALIVSAALFGLLHVGNPHATSVSTAAIALEAGVLLAAAYALARSLWLPIGLHFAWNFTEGGVFGASVSGGKAKGLLNAPIAGPELWSGGPFGPEASVVAVGACLAVALVMLVMAVRRGHWQPMALRLRA